MRYTFEEEFRLDRPETAGETNGHFDLNNYKDWLEAQLIEARKQLALYNVVEQSKQLPPIYNPCSGCGADNPNERCINCFHDFGGN